MDDLNQFRQHRTTFGLYTFFHHVSPQCFLLFKKFLAFFPLKFSKINVHVSRKAHFDELRENLCCIFKAFSHSVSESSFSSSCSMRTSRMMQIFIESQCYNPQFPMTVTTKHLVRSHLFIGYRLFHVNILSKIIRHIKTGTVTMNLIKNLIKSFLFCPRCSTRTLMQICIESKQYNPHDCDYRSEKI